MANIDAPRGFWPVRHLTGGSPFSITRYKVTASATIYRGDPLKIVNGGTVEVAAAGDEEIVLGVAANYVVAASSGDFFVEVYDDPNIVFGIQDDASATLTIANVFQAGNFATYATGNTTTLISVMELNASDVGAKDAQLKILGLIDEPNNTAGDHADWEVMFNEHFYFGTRPAGV